MNTKRLYQTLKDKNNPNEVETTGPFLCNRNNAWLGIGYYFWDTFIELAHWWGKQGYQNSYIICQAICDNNLNEIFDLVGNTEQLSEFHEYFHILKTRNPSEKNGAITVSFIIEHMKRYSGNFNYKAIRAADSNLKNHSQKIPFNDIQKAFINYPPSIQMCLIEKRSLNLRNYQVIHPKEYCQNFTI